MKGFIILEVNKFDTTGYTHKIHITM